MAAASFDMPADPAIGFIGLGNMGAPMVANLRAAGFRLWVHDRSPEIEALVAAGTGGVPATPDMIADIADLVILMLPNGAVVRELLIGNAAAGGVLDRLRPGAVIVDMGSSAPAGTRELGAIVAARARTLIDAPVSGGVGKARSAELTIMMGGDQGVLDAIEPVFAAMASRIMHVGPLGAGHAMKALNNYVSAAGLVAACEAVAVAERFGIDPEAALQVLNASTGRNNSTETKLARFVLSGAFDSGFSLGLMRKDLVTALELAGRIGAAPRLMRDIVDFWGEAEATLGAAADHTEIARLAAPPERSD